MARNVYVAINLARRKKRTVLVYYLLRAYHRSGICYQHTNILKRHYLYVSFVSNKQELRIRATLICPRTGLNMRQLSLTVLYSLCRYSNQVP